MSSFAFPSVLPHPASMHTYPPRPAYPSAQPVTMPPRTLVGSSSQHRYSLPAPAINSAHGPSANPDEDWTKISDLAERRRIQNRIAQRAYRERKKLKRRLEDLERRASSTPPNQHQPVLHDDKTARRLSRPGSMAHASMLAGGSPSLGSTTTSSTSVSSFDIPPGTMAPAMSSVFGPNGTRTAIPIPRHHDMSRQTSLTPPPSLTYSSYSSTNSPNLPTGFSHPVPSSHHASYNGYLGATTAESYPTSSALHLPPPSALSRTPPLPAHQWGELHNAGAANKYAGADAGQHPESAYFNPNGDAFAMYPPPAPAVSSAGHDAVVSSVESVGGVYGAPLGMEGGYGMGMGGVAGHAEYGYRLP